MPYQHTRVLGYVCSNELCVKYCETRTHWNRHVARSRTCSRTHHEAVALNLYLLRLREACESGNWYDTLKKSLTRHPALANLQQQSGVHARSQSTEASPSPAVQRQDIDTYELEQSGDNTG